MEGNRQIPAFVQLQNIVRRSHLVLRHIRHFSVEQNFISVPNSDLQHIGKFTINIGKIQPVIDVPSALVFDKKLLFYRHARFKEKFMLLDHRIAVVEVKLDRSRMEQVILHRHSGIDQCKGGNTQTDGKNNNRNHTAGQLFHCFGFLFISHFRIPPSGVFLPKREGSAENRRQGTSTDRC